MTGISSPRMFREDGQRRILAAEIDGQPRAASGVDPGPRPRPRDLLRASVSLKHPQLPDLPPCGSAPSTVSEDYHARSHLDQPDGDQRPASSPMRSTFWRSTDDSYEETTYRETRIQVHRFAAGLLSLGIKKGDRIARNQRRPKPLGDRRARDLLHRGHQRTHFGEDQRGRSS